MPKAKTEQASATPTTAPVAAATWRHIDELSPWAKNPRVNEKAIPKVERSIRRFGFPTVMTVRAETGELVAGHTRQLAMRAILAADPEFTLVGAPGPGFVPVREHQFASDAEAHAFAVADNRLAEEAEWDDARLHDVAAEVLASGEFDDISVLGFDDDEAARILAEPEIPMEPEGDGTPDAAGPSTPTGPHASPDPANAPAPSTVRMVQLFLDDTTQPEFMEHVKTLAARYGTKNVTETVLEVVKRAAQEL